MIFNILKNKAELINRLSIGVFLKSIKRTGASDTSHKLKSCSKFAVVKLFSNFKEITPKHDTVGV